MPATWPAQLQDKLDQDSFTFKIGETSIRTEMDIGPAKVRRRFTKSVDALQCQIRMTYSDFQYVYNFWDLDLNGGAGTFYFNHPFTGVQTVFRMVGPPEISPLGGTEFIVSMQWEAMP